MRDITATRKECRCCRDVVVRIPGDMYEELLAELARAVGHYVFKSPAPYVGIPSLCRLKQVLTGLERYEEDA